MNQAQSTFGWVLLGLACLAWFVVLNWLFCRLTARRCPRCERRWTTELLGEWDGEDWHCRYCGNYWTHKA